MKIAINKCYGGFDLSHKAVMRYAELKNIKLFPVYHQDGIILHDLNKAIFIPWNGEKTIFSVFYLTEPLPENGIPNKKTFFHYGSDRNDPILIQTIEELGEEANGDFSKLAIIEIPDGVDWEIEEYDGWESIVEKHRSWG